MTEGKPREWWIFKKLWKGVNRAYDPDKMEGPWHPTEYWHVIEKSYADKLEAELEAIKKLFSVQLDMVDKIEKLQAEVAALKLEKSDMYTRGREIILQKEHDLEALKSQADRLADALKIEMGNSGTRTGEEALQAYEAFKGKT